MKKQIIVLLLIFSARSITAQQIITTTQKVNKDYLKKSKKEKRTGGILLAGGIASFTGGVIAMNHTQSKGENEFPFVLGGLMATISSVPFFISSTVNKHKAKLELGKQAILTIPGTNNNIYQTSVSLKIAL